MAKAPQAEALAPKGNPSGLGTGATSEPDQVRVPAQTTRWLRILEAELSERAARLERLAAEVRSGRYRVDVMAVSRRLVDEALHGE
jgi:anti-sigma28 factor (negative regulator of flagellin synthesis)